MLLSSVLLLTEVWHYSVLHAGLGLMPGPLMAALFAAPAGRLGAKIGQPPVIAAGGLIFAAGFAINLAAVGSTPDYGSFLPGFLLGGVGVGLVLGPLPAAATMSLPPDRFATGTAVFGMARQVGSAIGVAVLVALLADPAPADLFSHLQQGWVFALATGVVAGALALAIGSPAEERKEAEVEGLAPQRA
jgi:MFS family permease